MAADELVISETPMVLKETNAISEIDEENEDEEAEPADVFGKRNFTEGMTSLRLHSQSKEMQPDGLMGCDDRVEQVAQSVSDVR